jgi:hypothetical protein
MEEFLNKYNILDINNDLYSYKLKTIGRDANKIKNPIIFNNGKYIMYCERDTEVLLDIESINKIKQFEEENDENLVFYRMKNNYILISLKNRKRLYIHQIITGCYGNGKGTKNISVDHIDQNPINNCFTNLRVTDRKTQEQNSKGIKAGTKRERKKNAKQLPAGITQNMLPKYVVYYKECVNKEKNKYREFFKIEKHPKLKKAINSTKSNKIHIFDKLEEIKQKLIMIDKDE